MKKILLIIIIALELLVLYRINKFSFTKFSFTKFSFTKNEKRTFNLVKTKNYISNNKVRTEFPKCKPCPIFENN